MDKPNRPYRPPSYTGPTLDDGLTQQAGIGFLGDPTSNQITAKVADGNPGSGGHSFGTAYQGFDIDGDNPTKKTT